MKEVWLVSYIKIIIENYKNKSDLSYNIPAENWLINFLMYSHIRLIHLIFNHIIISITLISIRIFSLSYSTIYHNLFHSSIVSRNANDDITYSSPEIEFHS